MWCNESLNLEKGPPQSFCKQPRFGLKPGIIWVPGHSKCITIYTTKECKCICPNPPISKSSRCATMHDIPIGMKILTEIAHCSQKINAWLRLRNVNYKIFPYKPRFWPLFILFCRQPLRLHGNGYLNFAVSCLCLSAFSAFHLLIELGIHNFFLRTL